MAVRMSASKLHIELNEVYTAHNYNPLPIVIARGLGAWVWDTEGNKYLDCLSAYSALNHGHCHPRLLAALKKQATKLSLTSRAFLNDVSGPFFKELAELCGKDMVLPMNTGAEAVETAIKMARKWGYTKKHIPYCPEKHDCAWVVVFRNNFHGRTTTIVGFSSETQYREGFGPFTPGFVDMEYGNGEELEGFLSVHGKSVAAVLLEPIQGEAGIIVPPQGFLREVRELCTKHNVLMIADEIQTGLGRTGKMFACDHERIKPDVYVLGKALGGGLYPVSAVVANKDILDVFRPGDHGSTFGGNPLACAVGREAIRVIREEGLAEKASELGEYFMNELRGIKSSYVKEVRGKGLLIGVELKKEAGLARPFCEKLMELGVLAKETHEQVIRFAPPLVITKKEIDWALERTAVVLKRK